MEYKSDAVWECDDLRRYIFSYLRKDAKLKCCVCNKVCIWDKKVCDYIDVNYQPWNINGSTYCSKCYKNISISMNCLIS